MATVFFITLTFFFSLTCLRLSESLDAQPQSTSIGGDPTSSFKVPLDLFVMSKCPDAIRCEARINDVLKRVVNITKVRPNFIASTEDYHVSCKHGETECAGDEQQLCMYRYASADAFWQFVMCQNADPPSIGQAHAADFCISQLLGTAVISNDTACKVRDCYGSREGKERLRESADFTWSEGVSKSCTIWVDDRPRCVHDGGVWYNCPGGPEVEDFVDTICKAFWSRAGYWSEECQAIHTGRLSDRNL